MKLLKLSKLMPVLSVFYLCTGSQMALAVPEPVEIGQIVKRFVNSSPELAALKERRKAAERRVTESRGAFLPTVAARAQVMDQRNVFRLPLSASLPTQTIVSEEKTYSADLVLEQPLIAGGGRLGNYRLRKAELSAAEIEYLQNKNRAVGGVVLAVADYLGAQDAMRVVEESEKTFKQFYDITRSRWRKGAALNFELEQAKSDYESYGPRLRSAKVNLDSAARRLRSLLVVDPDFPLPMAWPKFTAANTARPNFRELAEKRPERLHAESDLARAEAAKRLAIAGDLPSLAFTARYGYQAPEASDLGDDNSEVYAYGFVLNVPLFSGGTGVNRYRAAESERMAAEKGLRVATRDAVTDLESYYDHFVVALQNLESVESVNASARRALQLGSESYRVGRVSLMQVVQLQASAERAELQRVQAYREAFAAEIAWQSAIGSDLEAYYSMAANENGKTGGR